LAAIVGAGTVRGFDWSHLHVAQDPVFQRQIADTVEFRSLFHMGLGQAAETFVGNYGLLLLLLPFAASKALRLSAVTKWALLVALSMLALTIHQERWGDFLAVALVMTAGLVVQARWGKRPWICAALMVVATLPPWWQAGEIHAEARKLAAQPMLGWYGTTMVMEAVSTCLPPAAEPPVVLAEWSQGGYLAGMGKARVVGSGYWSNLQGLKDNHELFTTNSEQRFGELVKDRHIEYFFRPPPEFLTNAIENSFRVLGRGNATREQIRETVLWRVAYSSNLPVVACPELGKIAPACSLLKLR
jgi:hypothetical protein